MKIFIGCGNSSDRTCPHPQRAGTAEPLRLGQPRSFACGCAPLLLVLCLWTLPAFAQFGPERVATLPRDRYKNGAVTLRAFAPVAEAVKDSVAKIDLNRNTVVLGAIIEENGLVVTKASEIKEGKLTCWLANGNEVDAQLLAKDDDNDVALIKINATGLKPIQWTSEETSVGQWVLTPGIKPELQAVGVISVPRTLYRRAYIGVLLDFTASNAKIAQIMSGLGAEKAGLKPGDSILAVNGQSVKDSEDLILILRTQHEGQTVKLRVQRQAEEFDATIPMMVPKTDLASTNRSPGTFSRLDRMNRLGGDVSRRADGFALAIQHDTVLPPWLCGGPLVNLEGKAIGLNIARAGRVVSYALPPDLVKQIVGNLKAQAQRTAERPRTEPTSQKRELPAKQQ